MYKRIVREKERERERERERRTRARGKKILIDKKKELIKDEMNGGWCTVVDVRNKEHKVRVWGRLPPDQFRFTNSAANEKDTSHFCLSINSYKMELNSNWAQKVHTKCIHVHVHHCLTSKVLSYISFALQTVKLFIIIFSFISFWSLHWL